VGFSYAQCKPGDIGKCTASITLNLYLYGERIDLLIGKEQHSIEVWIFGFVILETISITHFYTILT